MIQLEEETMNREEKVLNLCPICYEGQLTEKTGDHKIKVKDGERVREIVVKDLQWRECENCGERFFDNVNAEKIEVARYRALGLLSPEDLKTIRNELGFSQTEMADFLKVGSKSYCRWENGSLMQSKSMDALIRYAYADRQRERVRTERVKRAATYLSVLRKADPGTGKDDLPLAAHSSDVSPKEIKEIGKKYSGRNTDLMNEVVEIVAENLDLNPEDIAEALLLETGVRGTVPTAEKKVLDYLGLKMVAYDFVGDVLFVPKSDKQDVRALLSFSDKTIAVQKQLLSKPTRLKFSIFHEVGHFVLPEHLDAFYVCSGDDLGYRARSEKEAEANRFAANMVFQVSLFSQEANKLPLSCDTLTSIAKKYGASFEATGRRYVEENQKPCALVVYTKVDESMDDSEFDGLPSFRPEYTITSPLFKKEFFTRILKEEIVPGKSAVLRAFQTMDPYKPIRSKMIIEILGKGRTDFDSELFTNGYKVFRLISENLDA
jgi:HTH-type transcriptional regulator / antitoxin MqsA